MITAALILSAAVSANAEYSAAYYSRMDGKSREELKAAAKQCVQSHRELVYMDLPNYWQYSDVYPELYQGKRRWWEMYSREVYLISASQSAKSSFSANRMQREHSVPKSWWKVGDDVEYTPAYTDLWNLYPSDASANMAKSNYPLGEVGSKASFDNGCTRVGTPKAGYGGGAGSVFEPADEYKGDFARGFFYMATVYDDLPWVSRYNWMFNRNSYPTLQPWAFEMLLQWARQDPVSQKEIVRNDAVEQSQGNRNPFVDFPELAEYIWGTRTAEVFRIDEQQGPMTPPITGDPFLTMPVNNETLDFGDVAVTDAMITWLLFKGGNLTAPLSVRIGGVDRAMFTLASTTISASSVNSTGEYMLPVQYLPTSLGEHTATISITDGGLSGSLRVNLKGKGCEIPWLTRLNALPPSDVTPNSYIACWQEAPEQVDYYILYRTRYYPDGVETDELQASSNSLPITDRNPEVMESYQVVSSRLGFHSEKSNVITIEASGVEEIIQNPPFLMIGWLEEGIRIITDAPVLHPVEIYDVTGTLIKHIEGLQHGDIVNLPQGCYIITSPDMKKPVKILI